MKCGLLGRRLGHSYSPQIHACLGSYSYELFEKEPEELAQFLRHGDFTGINVTVPYKKAVIPFLDELSVAAARLGAVNTVIRRDGKLIGHNTDYFGFLTMVGDCGLDVSGKKVLVLGSGGASNTAVTALQELGARVVTISRSGENHYGNLQLHSDASIIVNTTPVGMFPHTEDTPLSLDTFPCLEGVLDVIYNPSRTRLLQEAHKRSLVTRNGLLMLVAQACEASQWFTGTPVPQENIRAIHTRLRGQMENIVLIGMPGCGKSTVGKTLAAQLNRPFVDSDQKIMELAGKSIPDIFREDGEAAFRALETQVLRELGKQSGLVIATGGGCVTRVENSPLLRCNGTLFWLQRDPEKLPTDGRPLSQANSPAELYRVRRPMYEAFADHRIDNNASLQETLEEINRHLPAFPAGGKENL